MTKNSATDFRFEDAVASSPTILADAASRRGAEAVATSLALLSERRFRMRDKEAAHAGTLTTLGLVATGSFPVIAFSVWLLGDLSTTPSHALAIYDLSLFVLAVTGGAFLVVFGLLACALILFRGMAANAHQEPPKVYRSTQIELTWIAIPSLIVLVLFLTTERVMRAMTDGPRQPVALDAEIGRE
jgi:hypothetical protein